jgi:hypothetical protein
MLESYLPTQGDALLNPAYARDLLHAHLGGKDHTSRLWRILAFQVWRRDVLGGRSAARATV